MRLIFIPGLLCTEKVWGKLNTLRDVYEAQDADVSSYNSITAMADAVVAQVNQDDEYCVIGLSMGGYVALELASRQLAWLKKLILINTTAQPTNPATIPGRKEAMALAHTEGMHKVLQLMPGICFYQYTEALRQLEYAMADAVGADAYVKQQTAIMGRASYAFKLNDIIAKTLVITSHEDRVLPFDDSVELHRGITGSQLHSFSQCGHLPTLERQDETLATVSAFLNK